MMPAYFYFNLITIILSGAYINTNPSLNGGNADLSSYTAKTKIPEERLEKLIDLFLKSEKSNKMSDQFIPHFECELPWKLRNTTGHAAPGEQFCIEDATMNTDSDFWCSTSKWFNSSTADKSTIRNCLTRGSEIANASIWKPHEDCSPLFSHNTSYYYQKCTTANSMLPWCAVGINPSTSWRYCIDITPRWTSWEAWTSCSLTCGNGTTVRNRECKSGKNVSIACVGNLTEKKSCNVFPCPIHGNWSNWSEYSSCSPTCNRSSKFRVRYCDQPRPVHSGESCVGHDFEIMACYLPQCPKWIEWSPWSQCTKLCGTGIQTRNRTCLSGNATSDDCYGGFKERLECNTQDCIKPIHDIIIGSIVVCVGLLITTIVMIVIYTKLRKGRPQDVVVLQNYIGEKY